VGRTVLPKLDRKQEQETQLEVEVQYLQDQINRAQDESKTLARNIDSLKKQVAHHKSELRGVRPNFEDQSQRLQNSEAELKNHQDSVNQVTDEVFSDFCERLGYDSIRDYEAQQGTVQQEAAEKRNEFSTQRIRLQFVLKQHESSHGGAEKRLQAAEDEINRRTADITELEAKQEELQNAIDVLVAELETLKEERDQLNEKLTERAAAVKEARRVLDQRNDKVKNVVKEVNEEDAKIKTCATNRFNVLKDCRVNEINLPLTEDSKPLTSLPMTDAPRPDADAMDVDEDPESTMIEPAQVDDYGIEVDFEELDEELRTELTEILEHVCYPCAAPRTPRLTYPRRMMPMLVSNNKPLTPSRKLKTNSQTTSPVSTPTSTKRLPICVQANALQQQRLALKRSMSTSPRLASVLPPRRRLLKT
jgi:structural maintenance of chromosome 1